MQNSRSQRYAYFSRTTRKDTCPFVLFRRFSTKNDEIGQMDKETRQGECLFLILFKK